MRWISHSWLSDALDFSVLDAFEYSVSALGCIQLLSLTSWTSQSRFSDAFDFLGLTLLFELSVSTLRRGRLPSLESRLHSTQSRFSRFRYLSLLSWMCSTSQASDAFNPLSFDSKTSSTSRARVYNVLDFSYLLHLFCGNKQTD